jgi:hypothetical protein
MSDFTERTRSDEAREVQQIRSRLATLREMECLLSESSEQRPLTLTLAERVTRLRLRHLEAH